MNCLNEVECSGVVEWREVRQLLEDMECFGVDDLRFGKPTTMDNAMADD